jgi:ribosome-associated protein
MVDTAKSKEHIIDLAKLLDEHKGEETVAIYIGDHSGFTDYFLISTVSSAGHTRGLTRHIKSKLSELGIQPFHRQKKLQEDSWVLIDCGWFVIHLMDRDSRDFYELEKLWHMGDIIYQSSKSS